jgi:hypothetical protein
MIKFRQSIDLEYSSLRGSDISQPSLFITRTVEDFVPANHPLRAIRKLIETTFGWAKQYGGLRRMMYRGRERVSSRVTFTMAVFNLLRISHLVPEPTG